MRRFSWMFIASLVLTGTALATGYGKRRAISPSETVVVALPFHSEGGRRYLMPADLITGSVEFRSTAGHDVRVDIKVDGYRLKASVNDGRSWVGEIRTCYRDLDSPRYVSWANPEHQSAADMAYDTCIILGQNNWVQSP